MSDGNLFLALWAAQIVIFLVCIVLLDLGYNYTIKSTFKEVFNLDFDLLVFILPFIGLIPIILVLVCEYDTLLKGIKRALPKVKL